MNKDETLYIYEDLLRKNIEKINYYLNQENANLDKECEIMSESLNYYKSDKNTAKIETEINNFKETLDSILFKRKRYVEVLEKVIILYNNLTNKTTQVFTEMGNIKE